MMVWTLIGLFASWCVAALYLDARPGWLRWPVLGIFFGVLAVSLVMPTSVWKKLAGVLVVIALVMGWWLSLKPSNDRAWRPDVAVLPWAEITGDTVRIHNIRNCDYRTETDFEVRHYDKTLDLRQLRTVDLFLVYWGSPLIGHTMVSFGFAGGDQVCFSIETRMERGESYSALRGFFRQFELTYVIADERDVVRLRTNYRQGEEVYLYRLRITPERARSVFLDYLRRANKLHQHPAWYNALTDNCTTNIRLHADAARGHRSPLDWRILLNGRLDEMLAEHGAFAADLPLSELKPRCHVNTRARAAGQAPDISARIREGVPGVEK
jgi:hypothetical protein